MEADDKESAMAEAMDWKAEPSSTIASECAARRAALDSSDRTIASQTFASLQWAVALLQQMENKERHDAVGGERKKEEEEEEKEEEADVGEGKALKKELPAVEEDDGAALCDSGSGNERVALALKKGEIGSDADKEHGAAENEGLQVRSGGAKRGREGEACPVEGGIVGDVDVEEAGGDDLEAAVQAAVQEADSGAAGVHIVERMEAQLAQTEHKALTDLISHCLLVSLDQQPPMVENTWTSSPHEKDFTADEGSIDSRVRDSENHQMTVAHGSEHMVLNAEEEGKQSKVFAADLAWLHKWLVRYLMRNHDSFRILHREPLDWLLAHLTASNPILFLKLVFEDLVQEVVSSDSRGWAAVATYVQRVGILDNVALKMPEHVFPVLQSLFSDLQLAIELAQRGERKIEDRSVKKLVGTLSACVVVGTLCPRFLGAFAHLWVPMLTVENVRVWSKLLLMVDQEAAFLPSINAVLAGVSLQEPSLCAWLCALLSWRLSELASVGADIVLLLSRLIEASSLDEATQHLSDMSDLLLHMLYRDLTKGVLRCVLGAYQPCCEAPLDPFAATTPQEETGVGKFVANLKNNVHRLWSEALNLCSNSTCLCCAAATSHRNGVDPAAKTDGGLSVNVISTSSGSDDKVRFDKPNRPASMDIVGETEETLGDRLGQEQDFRSRERGCQLKDPFVRICHLVILSSSSHMVAEVIAEATLLTLPSKAGFERRSVQKLLVVMRIMRMMAGQGRGAEVIERWGQLMVNDLAVSSNEQALLKLLAVRQLLDPRFWQNHFPAVQEHVSRPSIATDSEQNDDSEMEGLTWKLVLQLVRKELDFHWLQLLLLLHRKDAWNLQLVVLGVLQLLSPGESLQPQAITVRLKGALGIYFWWLENGDDKSSAARSGASGEHGGLADKWQQVRVLEQLKHVIVQLAAATSSTFTLLVSSLLDYSFERCAHNPDFQMRKSNLHRRGIGAGARGYLSVASLVSGRLDQHGNFKLVSVPTVAEKKRDGFSLSPCFLLTKENRKIKSRGLSSLDFYEREKLGARYSKGDLANPSSLLPTLLDAETRRKDDSTETTILDLTRLLQWALQRAVLRFSENPDAWPSHPAKALATMMVDRLETPHEMPMTMEQYEEVLPKQVSSSRHIFLTDWFIRNPLLFEMLELVVKQGVTHEIMRCIEFVRVLLADNISRWHSACRTRRDPSVVEPVKASKEETFDRLQVIRLIQLVADAGWLPQPLASSTKIVELIDGADVAELLLLVWRCMHHAMTLGYKCWESYSHDVNHGTARASDNPQVALAVEENKEGTYTEWEGLYFGILRRNIAQIGALFARVYPLRSAF